MTTTKSFFISLLCSHKLGNEEIKCAKEKKKKKKKKRINILLTYYLQFARRENMTATKTRENVYFIICSHKQGKEEMM